MSSVEKERKKSQKKVIIHRRPNKEIVKSFVCTVLQCAKAYGSYPALYTHMKKKHNRIPQMKDTKAKIGKKGRPTTKEQQQIKIQQQQGQCRICNQNDCKCVDKFDTQENNMTIRIMSDETFIDFANMVGTISNQNYQWVRNTQKDYIYKSPQQIQKMVLQFKSKFRCDPQISEKLETYLSFSSKYWDNELIDQLYFAIFAIKSSLNPMTAIEFFNINTENFPHIALCIESQRQEFESFIQFMTQNFLK